MNAQPAIRILTPGDEIALEDFLRPRLAASMFLISNLRQAGLVDHGQRYGGTYAAAFQEGKMVGAVAHYWNGQLVPQAPQALQALWPVAVRASGRPVKGVIGLREQVDAIVAALPVDPGNWQLDEVEYLYSLSLHALVVPPALLNSSLSARRIGPEDVNLIYDWRVANAIEALGETDNPEMRRYWRAAADDLCREGRTWLLEAAGRPLSTSSFNAAIPEAVQVGGVWTPPELRRRGYGRAVVAASLLEARQQGVGLAILFTGVKNVPAQKAYEGLGFRRIGDFRLVRFKEGIRID